MCVRAVAGAVGALAEAAIATGAGARSNTTKADIVLRLAAQRKACVAALTGGIAALIGGDSRRSPPVACSQTVAVGPALKLRASPRASPLTAKPVRAERAQTYVARSPVRPPPAVPVPAISRPRRIPPSLRT